MEDLIGLGVYDADTFVYYGNDLPKSCARARMMSTRSRSLGKKNYLIPAVASVVREIDLEKGKMLIRPIKGIFDDED